MADKDCKIEGCERVEQLRQGYCKPHYRRFMAHGDPLFNLTAPRHLDIWGRIEFHGWDEVSGPLKTPCWVYRKGHSSRNGYGSVRFEGKTHMAHRVSYLHFYGAIPENLLIRHACDNPPCINPKHLSTGTVKDNTRDMLERGRHVPPRGEMNGNAILTDELVWDILDRRVETDLSYVGLAEEFGMSMSMIAFICQGKRWVHVFRKWRAANPTADLRTTVSYG